MAKPKTIAAIEPNAGLRAALQKKIAKLVRARTRPRRRRSSRTSSPPAWWAKKAALAQDAKPTVKDFKAVDLEKAPKRADTAYAERLARWMIHTGEDAKAVSKWFCPHDGAAHYREPAPCADSCGHLPELIKNRWTVPVVKNRYISPAAAQEMPKLIDDMTGLITKMQADDLERLRGAP